MSTPTGNDPNQPGPNQPDPDQPGRAPYDPPRYEGAQTGPDQYGQTPYPQGQYGAGAPAQAPRNGMGVTALVLGIVGLVLTITLFLSVVGGLLGLLAIIFAIVGLSRAKKGQATNRGVALGGLITGILALLGAVVIIVLLGAAFVGIGGGDYISCLQEAGQDQAQIQQCQQQFQQQVDQQSGG